MPREPSLSAAVVYHMAVMAKHHPMVVPVVRRPTNRRGGRDKDGSCNERRTDQGLVSYSPARRMASKNPMRKAASTLALWADGDPSLVGERPSWRGRIAAASLANSSRDRWGAMVYL